MITNFVKDLSHENFSNRSFIIYFIFHLDNYPVQVQWILKSLNNVILDILLIISIIVLSYPLFQFLRVLIRYIYNRYIWRGEITVRKFINGELVDYYTLRSDKSIITHGINNDSSIDSTDKSERNE